MKKFIFILILLLSAACICYATKFVEFSVFLLIIIIGLIINSIIILHLRKANKNNINFMMDSRRNFDAIVIGQPLTKGSIKKIKGDKVLYFTHKKRTLFASYLFLIHQYSYLREDGLGTIYINSSKDKENNELYATIYDVYSFHPIIKNKLGVGLALKFPIIFYYKKFRSKDFFIDNKYIPIKERILQFCLERNLNIEFIYQ